MRFPIRPLSLVCSLLLALAAEPLRAAPVFFSDGASHAIPGDPAFVDDDWIVLNGDSSLAVAAPARVTGEGSLANDFAFGGDGLISEVGTIVRMTGGGIFGGSAGVIANAGSPVAGLAAFGGYAADVGGLLEVSGGTLTGGAASATAGTSIDQTSTFSGTGLQLAGAVATVHGGRIESGLASARGALLQNSATSGDALIVGSNSSVVLRNATIVAGAAQVANQLSPEGDAVASGGRGLWVLEDATVVVESGGATGGDAIAQAGFQSGAATATPGPALVLELGNRIAIRGGDFAAGIGAVSAAIGEAKSIAASPAILVEATSTGQPTRVTLLGGRFRGNGSLRVPFAATGPSDARIVILGGDLDSTTGIDLDLAHPSVTTVIYGLGLALNGVPLASGPVTAANGTLTGTLPMGGAFSWTFKRQNAAPLEVRVPEPVTGLLPGLALLAWLAPRRTASRG